MLDVIKPDVTHFFLLKPLLNKLKSVNLLPLTYFTKDIFDKDKLFLEKLVPLMETFSL